MVRHLDLLVCHWLVLREEVYLPGMARTVVAGPEKHLIEVGVGELFVQREGRLLLCAVEEGPYG